MKEQSKDSQMLATAITRAASTQTYLTIRWLVDRGLKADAYRAYGYFRWLDDMLDDNVVPQGEKFTQVERQQALLEACYRGETPALACPEEQILVDLVHHDTGRNSGLRSYLRNMMDVMAFDVQRRGQEISRLELSEYTRKLATAVTDALHYFIGHQDPPPSCETRYLAVTAAHITHMLRDTHEDGTTGYFNIPREYLQQHGISAQEVDSVAYRKWVCTRVRLANQYFNAGRKSLSQVKSLRCRLAGYAYMARFQWMLHTIERERFCLRQEYPERKHLRAGLWVLWSTLASVITSGLERGRRSCTFARQSPQVD